MNGYNIKSLLIAVIMMIVSSTVLYSADQTTTPPEPNNEGVVSCKILKPITVKFNPYSSKLHKIVVVQAGTTKDNGGGELTGFSLEVTGSGNEDIKLQISCDNGLIQNSSADCQYISTNNEGVSIGVDFEDTLHDTPICIDSYIINEEDGYWSGEVNIRNVSATADATLGVHYFTFTATANYTCL